MLRWSGYIVGSASWSLALQDLRVWVRTTWLGHDLVELGLPWFCLPATRFLDRQIRSGMQVFEWGSGASTLFFARRGCSVTSAEHDTEWAARSRARLASYADVDVLEFDAADDAYVTSIDAFPSRTLDLVAVDGRRRCDCFRRALSRVKPGGWLILDDSERPQYRSCLEDVLEEDWEVRHFEGPRPGSIWPVFGRTSCLRRRETT